LRVLGAAAVAEATGPVFAADRSGPAQAGVSDLQAAMARGTLTSVQLARRYLARIEQIDRRGPHLRSVLEVNPEAITIAAALDAERRAKGPRGPLHGIPVLVKDNVATGDRLSTSAGSLALANAKAPRDASLVGRLREAGAVVLGKTNLSEWANIRSSHSTSGWSGRGGLTLNPYALDRNPSGSSSGSAVAVAAGLAPVAIGTETDGSIVSPASICSLVGISRRSDWSAATGSCRSRAPRTRPGRWPARWPIARRCSARSPAPIRSIRPRSPTRAAPSTT